ncbi:MAG: hypothetical protein LBS56_08910 [Propionibacteriaceae bacterium]|jgi:CRISPR-associated protein (TIGR03984 family)|nr:hypothetical protein [Propionibacteriaceae bacterium]
MTRAVGAADLATLLASPPEGAPDFRVGWFESPQRAGFAARTADGWATHEGPLDTKWCYDARLFDQAGELHWWWEPGEATGRWSHLSDATAAGRGWSPAVATDSTPPRRLLRGSVREVDGAWSRLHDGHSRPTWAPLRAERGSRVAIGAVEYVAVDGRGNVAVVAERLTSLAEWKEGL